MPARAEHHLLLHDVGVGDLRVVRRHEVGQVHQVLRLGGQSCAGVGHGAIMLCG
jgi:hypothetical protein